MTGRSRTGSPVEQPAAPPQNLDAEQAVLGTVLLADTALEQLVDEQLQPEDFYREQHGRIYRAMLDLQLVGEPVDQLTLADQLQHA
ncbi:MAG: DnaB-like helicase N-terminal domain-containing protein, partial [Thermoleophilaceae bacterium]